MKKLHPMYGYQDSLFEVLSSTIVIDEMKITEGVEFDKALLHHWGLVNLGKHPPESLKGEVADHALVVMFQPFKGKWHQSLGCFLSKGNVKGDILAKILLEGITLSEDAVLKVDAIICDGATWNRKMWQEFNISEESSSCTHPCEEGRRLWFLSDWSHLLKCMRNALCPLPPKSKKAGKKTAPENNMDENEDDIMNSLIDEVHEHTNQTQKSYINKEMNEILSAATGINDTSFQTPDGTVKRRHWVALWHEEEKLEKKTSA
ncbi:Transposable element P transposase [Frankliniella fusca]|uniref:Transposable element P transposase n=1 Tax=Frankliniella fusca TaxID=407009 RepID=A0AAE1LQZ8_9NEOP|nr:Transposable element P transposase [Frankliniella fusca]